MYNFLTLHVYHDVNISVLFFIFYLYILFAILPDLRMSFLFIGWAGISASGYLQSARVSERLAVSVGVAKSAAETLVATPTANGPQVGGSRGKWANAGNL